MGHKGRPKAFSSVYQTHPNYDHLTTLELIAQVHYILDEREANQRQSVRVEFLRRTCELPASPPRVGFPRLWALFPVILSRSVRERMYDPACQELLEDYAREWARWRTPRARRWVRFAFTVRTACLVGGCAWEALGEKGRKVAVGSAAILFGPRVVGWVRERVFEMFGRLL